MSKPYYEAYDDRYRQVHGENLQWASSCPTLIVRDVMARYGLTQTHKILELGCGEGRDAAALLTGGWDLLATDISPEAIAYCTNKMPGFQSAFRVLDCVRGGLEACCDFIYAVAVVHMLVEADDRDGFYGFIRNHLNPEGIGLICTMGDGTWEMCSNASEAFELRERTHQLTGKKLMIAGTSCRVVSFDAFREELERNGLAILEDGITAAPPDFPEMMYAVVKVK